MKNELLNSIAQRVKTLVDFRIPDDAVLGIQVSAIVFEYVERYVEADVRNARKRQIAPKNTNACRTFNRLCQFFNVCTGSEDAEDRSLWHRPESVHAELETSFPERGKNIITNSRLGDFMTCRRKHHLRYEEGLVPVRSSDAESLRWGTLLHDLMEIVWGSYRRER